MCITTTKNSVYNSFYNKCTANRLDGHVIKIQLTISRTWSSLLSNCRDIFPERSESWKPLPKNKGKFMGLFICLYSHQMVRSVMVYVQDLAVLSGIQHL